MHCHIFVFLLILNVNVWQEPYCLYLCLTVIKQVKLNEHLSQPYLQGTSKYLNKSKVITNQIK